MLEDEVIQPSTSPWASPIVLVCKKDNSYRFCVDYRKLNEVTHKDAYPLPRIDDTLNTLAGSKWFSTLDLLKNLIFLSSTEGKKHTNANSLSRLPCRQCGRETHGEVVIIATTQLSAVEDLRELQLSDPVIGPVFKSKLQNVHPPDSELKALSKSTRRLYQIWNQLVIHENRLYRQYQKTNNDDSVILQLIVPESKREQVLTEMHGGTMSRHLGEEKTLARICQRFYWPGYFNDVRD